MDLGAIDENVEFSAGAADSLISLCTSAMMVIGDQQGSRTSSVKTGLTDFKGLFSQLFRSNAQVQRADAELLIERLREVAEGARRLKEEAAKEQRRRVLAREWKARLDNRNAGDHIRDFFMGEEKPPVGPPADPSLITVQQPTGGERKAPKPGSGGGGGTTSSARPSSLRKFARHSAEADHALKAWPGRLRTSYEQFTEKCHFGTLGAAGVWTGFDRYLKANHQDVEWARTVAAAFAAAGGAGNISTLSNAAIAAALKAAGVGMARSPLEIDPPRAFGMPTTTGYADDPVNALSGNFLENEVDLGFIGGCATLEFSRTYNSRNPAVGGFGLGWSSWTETGLVLRDDQARWTLPDGRQVVFPRLGAGWDRALGENFWLERDGDRLVVSDNRGGRWRFTQAGQLATVERGAGTRVSLRWDQGRLTGLSHQRGRDISVTWDGARVAKVLSSDGRQVDYVYDDAGRLVAARGPQGERRYRWGEAGLIEAVADADGVAEATNEYDELGRVVAQTSAFGRRSRYAYLPGGITVVSDPDGTRSNTWIPDSQGRLAGVIDAEDQRQSIAYDRWGNLVSVVERDGSATISEFDGRGRRIRQVTPSGAEFQWAYDEQDRVTTVITEAGAVTTCRYVGDSRNPSEMVDPTGGVTRFEWAEGLLVQLVDPVGVVVRFDYDDHGDLIATIDAEGNAARLERDEVGRVVAAITPLGNRTGFTFDALGRLAEQVSADKGVWRYSYSAGGRLKSVIDPMGARTDIEYSSNGEESRTIDPLGRAITRSFDDLGNVSGVELPDGSTWQFSHDAMSRLVASTDPAGGVWTNKFDRNGQLVASVDPSGVGRSVTTGSSPNSVEVDDGLATELVKFDPLGRPVAGTDAGGGTVMASYDQCGRPVELLDGEGGLTRIERDLAGRVVAVTSPLGLTTSYRWDRCGRLEQVIDPAGAITTRRYDADGQVVAITSPTGETSSYRYDPAGRLVEAQEPGSGVTRRSFDRAGRLVRSYDSWNGHRRFSYDDAGQLVAATNGLGGITRYDYDQLGRVVRITAPDGGTTCREWDQGNHLVAETDPLGRITRAGYDPAGRQIWQTAPDGVRTEWAYDGSGRVESVSVAGRVVSRISRDVSGRSVRVSDFTDPNVERAQSYQWDRRGLLVGYSDDAGALSWTYDADGRRSSMTGLDGATTTYHWDTAGGLVGVEHPLLGRASFGFDAAGRLVRAESADRSSTWRYVDGWLAQHQLVAETSNTTTHVSRNADGLITNVERDGTRLDYAYDQAGQLIQAGPTTLTYDQCGRLTTETTTTGETRHYRYDTASQLLTITDREGETQFGYDECGRRRVEQHPNGRRREFEWSPTGWLSGITDHEQDHTSQVKVRVDAEGRLATVDETAVVWDVALPVPALAGFGSTPIVSAGPLTGIGNEWTSPGWRPARNTGEDPWTPPGVVGTGGAAAVNPSGTLMLTGLEWAGARTYDPTTRGFLTVDPLPPTVGSGWAANPYNYAGNDPLNRSDPTGLHPVSDADLAAYTAGHNGALAATGDWLANNWEYLAGGAMVIGGGVLVATGVGGPVGMMLVSAGADVIIQKATTGTVDPGEVVIAGALGAFGGGGTAAKLGLTGLKATVATGVMTGATGGGISGAYTYTRSPGPHTVEGFLSSTASGAAFGGLTGGAGAAAGHGLNTISGKLLSHAADSTSRIDGTLASIGHEGRTAGVLDIGGELFPLISGRGSMPNYAASGHVEGQAALIMRERDAASGALYIDNPNGICGYCTSQVPTLLPQGATLDVVAPAGTVPPSARWGNSRTFTGNDTGPKSWPR